MIRPHRNESSTERRLTTADTHRSLETMRCLSDRTGSVFFALTGPAAIVRDNLTGCVFWGPLGRGRMVAVFEDPAALPPQHESTAVHRYPISPLAAAQTPDNAHELFLKPTPLWKRTFDISIAAAALLILSPLLLLVAILIRYTSKGPVLFSQQRAGQGGRPFRMWKFRTMVPGAERLQASLGRFNEQDGPAFKMRFDPRVTRLGWWLRKSCLDELPQLWNVLRGEMSIVGPRPLPVAEQAACQLWQRRRLDIAPGMTCFWQVRRQVETTFDDWMRMDLKYIRRRSPLTDGAVLLATGLVSAAPSWQRALWLRSPAIRAAFPMSLALTDQAVVSGGRFLTTILIARGGGAAALGGYALALTILYITTSLHDALITTPYTVLRRQRRSRAARFLLGAAAAQHAVFAVAVLLAGVVIALACSFIGMGWTALLAAIAAPLVVSHEFGRRTSYAELRPNLSLGLDLVATTIQVSLLVYWMQSAALTARAGLAALAIGSLSGASIWLLTNYPKLQWSRRAARAVAVTGWRQMGRWNLAARLLAMAHGYSPYWLLAAFAGPAATGLFAAAMSLVSLANPLLLGMASYLGPQAAEIHHHRGDVGLRTATWKWIGLIAAILTPWSIALVMWGEPLAAIVFGAGNIDVSPTVLLVLAAHAVVGGASMILSQALVASNRAEVNLWINCAAVITTIPLAVALTPTQGVFGVVIALFVGNVVSTAAQGCGLHWPRRAA
jgi:lipopolysaccharide/colanic/teichoic acid biosynthesis glycosyltransferase/O-antigen/teichoic acid export membrane protein